MEVTSITADTFARMFLAGAKNLEAQKEWINDLNVFPVPDGDTGTNMTMTIMSAADEVSAIESPALETLSRAISSGSLRGARGNSGVILSQLFRGFCKVIKHSEEIDAMVLNESCQRAVETAYKAVMKPKEGTILTVARGMAERVAELSQETDDLTVIIREAIVCGDEVLLRTPEMLPVLAEAGVVDAGGQGLMQVIKGMYDELTGEGSASTGSQTGANMTGNEAPKAQADAESKQVSEAFASEEEIKFGYCTEFIILLNQKLSDDEVNGYKAYLESVGDSIVVVADVDLVKTHVHTNDPGMVIQKALTYGALSNIKIDNMRIEHHEKVIKDAAKTASDKPADTAAQETKESGASTRQEPLKDMGFVAVSVGEGINSILKELGVDVIVEGGQTMNPSTQDLLDAIAKVSARNVFVLPNNKNIVLAANQAASLTKDKNVIVIPTKTVPQGIGAMVNFMADNSAEENAAAMQESIASIATGQITYAVRDSHMDGFEIHEHDYMGIGDKGLLAAGTDLKDTLLEMVDAMVDEDSAIISIYFGEDVSEDDAAGIGKSLEEKYPDIEIEVENGGQPVYYYIVSVE
ncbi:MAG: DAK2 domain-containing protein [Clostridiales bacterium]|nr:DAK2 domain-containing protein [Clostridiales bacterium]